jgi:hypothetical protein
MFVAFCLLPFSLSLSLLLSLCCSWHDWTHAVCVFFLCFLMRKKVRAGSSFYSEKNWLFLDPPPGQKCCFTFKQMECLPHSFASVSDDTHWKKIQRSSNDDQTTSPWHTFYLPTYLQDDKNVRIFTYILGDCLLWAVIFQNFGYFFHGISWAIFSQTHPLSRASTCTTRMQGLHRAVSKQATFL